MVQTKDRLKKIRRILFDNGIKYGITEDEQNLFVFTYGIIIEDRIKMLEKLFKGHDVIIFKSKPEEITIKLK
jgi:hypothetical protein